MALALSMKTTSPSATDTFDSLADTINADEFTLTEHKNSHRIGRLAHKQVETIARLLRVSGRLDAGYAADEAVQFIRDLREVLIGAAAKFQVVRRRVRSVRATSRTGASRFGR